MAEWRAQHFLLAAVTLVVGLALGGLAPRSEIRGLRVQLAEQGDRGDRGSDRDRDVGREIATIFQGRPWEGDAPRSPEPEPEPEPASDGGPDAEPSEESLELPEESLDAMRDAMDLRLTQARAALAQQADASDEQMAEIDDVMSAMNADLHALATDAVAKFRESEGEPDRHDLMVFAADTLDVLIGAEEGLQGALDPDQREALADEALDPLSYVDPSIIDVLSELDRP